MPSKYPKIGDKIWTYDMNYKIVEHIISSIEKGPSLWPEYKPELIFQLKPRKSQPSFFWEFEINQLWFKTKKDALKAAFKMAEEEKGTILKRVDEIKKHISRIEKSILKESF